MLPRGLVLVTGPTGSAKVHDIGRHGPITVNDNRPRPQSSPSKTPRIRTRFQAPAWGEPARSPPRHPSAFFFFSTDALRSALRETGHRRLGSGEMRDLDHSARADGRGNGSPSLFGNAANTSSAAKPFDRIVDVFSLRLRKTWCAPMLFRSLRAGHLPDVDEKDRGGLIAAHEGS